MKRWSPFVLGGAGALIFDPKNFGRAIRLALVTGFLFYAVIIAAVSLVLGGAIFERLRDSIAEEA